MKWERKNLRRNRWIREDPILGSNYFNELARTGWVPFTYFSQYISNKTSDPHLISQIFYFFLTWTIQKSYYSSLNYNQRSKSSHTKQQEFM